jgi:hypothetical protein
MAKRNVTDIVCTHLLCSMVRQLLCLAHINVIRDHVCCERHNSNAETGEQVTKHDAVAEDGVFAPRFPLCPWVSKKGKIGHI